MSERDEHGMLETPNILPVKEQSDLITELVRERLDAVLPLAMKEAGLDMWIILCQEDDLDPVYETMIPMDCWTPILQMVVFAANGNSGFKKFSISGTDTKDLYERPYRGQVESEQWSVLRNIVNEYDPKTIGVNIGSVKWCAGGLSYNLYNQLKHNLGPKYSRRLVSAERAAVRWGATLTEAEKAIYPHVVKIAHSIIHSCYSIRTITPGVTTIDDLVWTYWQKVTDLGLSLAFRPYFSLIRSLDARSIHGPDDRVIRPGDMLHCDVGIKYLRLNTDNQHLAYVLRQRETDAPNELKSLMEQTNFLQEIFMEEFQEGITGNELQQRILTRARREGIERPKVYSHSLGLFLHQPGPLIGLPWEQKNPLPRGETKLRHNYAFAMELSTERIISEWGNQNVRCSMEEPVVFDAAGCLPLYRVQKGYYLI